MTHTTPGQLLRALRTERHQSIESLSFDANITPLALGNIERGIAVPQRTNLLALLDCLSVKKPVGKAERSKILTAYGYIDTVVSPNKVDRERAIRAWEESYQGLAYPNYLVDNELTIQKWNHPAEILYGIGPGKGVGVTLIDLLYGPPPENGLRVANIEDVTLKSVLHIWLDFLKYRDQQWCIDCIAREKKKYPAFAELYSSFSEEEEYPQDANFLEPLTVVNPDGQTMNFRLVTVVMEKDPRFCVDMYVPLDQDTLQILMSGK